jgi:hypothetical protein
MQQWKTNERQSRFPIRCLQPARLRGFASLSKWRVAGYAQFRGIDNIKRDHKQGTLPRIAFGA